MKVAMTGMTLRMPEFHIEWDNTRFCRLDSCPDRLYLVQEWLSRKREANERERGRASSNPVQVYGILGKGTRPSAASIRSSKEPFGISDGAMGG